MSNVTPQVRVWRSIQELGDQYKAGNKKPLEDLSQAWKQMNELPPDDPNSFFTLGGYHGAFTADIVDRGSGDKSVCSKPTGYETVRYPLAGLVGLLLANIGLVVARFSHAFPGSLAAQSGTPPVREFIAELWHWRELFDFVGTAKPRTRPTCAALIGRRTLHG